MVSWNPNQYLKFANERSRPCLDLIQRLLLDSPERIIDLGCGPGNSTTALARRWPNAQITGLDSSADMIAAARGVNPNQRWIQSDIATWTAVEPYDLIFSNAALQWVADHAKVFPQLLNQVGRHGALAVQMPANHDDSPGHRLMHDLAESTEWKPLFTRDPDLCRVHNLSFYYNILTPAATRLDLWRTDYIHILAGPEDIVEWYKGTGLRPYLEALPTSADRYRFVAAYGHLIARAYPRQSDGRVLFPFPRLFLIAYR